MMLLGRCAACGWLQPIPLCCRASTAVHLQWMHCSARLASFKLIMRSPDSAGWIGCSMVDVAAGTYSSFAVSADGRVEAWGLNNYGQLALPASTVAHHTPNVVPGLLDHKIAAVAGGQHHTLAVTEVSMYFDRGQAAEARGS
jgi:alpha-tubulin suppressor-like RCC1 family protein